jgi:hypothetical protein
VTRNTPDLPWRGPTAPAAPDPGPTPALTAGGDKPTPPTVDDLDAIHQRRVEKHERTVQRGAMAVASAIAQAPGLMAEYDRLRGRNGDD